MDRRQGRVFLHVGLHKTATTSLQATCLANQIALAQQGICYPDFRHPLKPEQSMANHSVPLVSMVHPRPHEYHMNIRMRVTDNRAAISSYRDVLDDALQSSLTVFLSGEGVSRLGKQALSQLLALLTRFDHQVRVVACVRSPYNFHCSALAQRVVGAGEALMPTDFQRQSDRLRVLQQVFGSALECIPFRTLCDHPNGPVVAFLERLQIDTSSFVIERRNDGASNRVTRLQIEVNQQYPLIIDNQINPSHYSVPRDSGRKFCLTPAEMAVIQSQLIEENHWMRSVLGESFCDQPHDLVNMMG